MNTGAGHGDIAEDATINILFTSTGGSIPTAATLGGGPAISVYKDNSITQSTAGITLTVDFDGVTGLNLVTIDTSADAFYAVGSDYTSVITTGSVGITSWVGVVVGTFSIENRFTDVQKISGSTAAADNLELMHNATGIAATAYPDGAVWVDTANGAAGTTSYVNGTAGNPVDSIADARTIAVALGLKRFRIISGSSFTLASSYDYYNFVGTRYTLALGGQSIEGTHILGANLSGTYTAAVLAPEFEACLLASITLTMDGVRVRNSRLASTVTLGDSPFLDNCHGSVGAAMDANLSASTVWANNYSGDLEIRQLVALGVINLEGFGSLTVNANCTGGTINVQGHFAITDNSGGAVTINDDNNYDLTDIISDSVAIDGSDVNALTSAGVTMSASERNAIADALLDRASGIEGGAITVTLRQAQRIILSALAGKLSGAGTTTVTIRDVNDGTNRIVATVNAAGNRTAITLDSS